MTDPLCRHDIIVTWGDPDNRLWACTACARRMYPACETCVDVGHRNETHVARADTAALAAAARAVVGAWDNDDLSLGWDGTGDLVDRLRAALEATDD